MKSTGPKKLNDQLKDIPLDNEYSYILVKYDESMSPFNQLVQTIEKAKAQILETVILKKEPAGKRTILIKLDIENVREVIFNLLKHRLIEIEGYNSKVRTIRKGEGNKR